MSVVGKTAVHQSSSDTPTPSRSPDGEPECGSTSDDELYPDWRRAELAEKYAPRDAYEPDEVME